MLNVYYVDVSKLDNEQIPKVREILDTFSFIVSDDISPNLYIKGYKVYLDEKYDFSECFKLPPECQVRQIG